MLGLLAILICVLIAAAILRRIQGTIITLPMIYTVMGLILGGRFLGLVELGPDNEIIRLVAEITLILVLASGASRIDVRWLSPKVKRKTPYSGWALPPSCTPSPTWAGGWNTGHSLTTWSC